MDRAVLRIIDANFNRAAEGLRAAEEVARLALDHEAYAGRLKSLRHSLRAAVDDLAPDWRRLSARDIEGDVGAGRTADDERERGDLADVAAGGLARAREALRVLEETAKLEGAGAAARIERIRYDLYAVERDLLLFARRRSLLEGRRLCLILSEELCVRSVEETLGGALRGGVDAVQLREKSLSDRVCAERARRVHQQCREAGVPLIVNDRAHVCVVIGAEGLHLGQNDLSVADARRVVGPAVLIGLSTHNADQLAAGDARMADYLGVGPVFATETKPHEPEAGLDGLRHAAGASPCPFFAVGGVTSERLETVLAAGARRIAVSRAVCAADDPERAARALRDRLDANL